MSVTRTFRCSSARAIAHAATVDPNTTVFDGYWAPGCRSRITAGQVAAMEGTISPELRIVTLPVDHTRLSPLAQEICMMSPACLNSNRAFDYSFRTGVMVRDVVNPTPELEQMWGREYWDKSFRWVLHWPTLHDTETPEHYYERCANLVQFTRLMFGERLSVERVSAVLAEVGRWPWPWDMARAVQANGLRMQTPE